MPLEFRRIRPHDARECVVDFFWRMRAWPYANKGEYFQYWDWRYNALSEEDPVAWIAIDDGKVVGHIAAYFRRYSLNGQHIRVGVPGNFLVDDAYRDTLAGARLGSSPRTLVRDDEVDLLLAYGNKVAHGMFVRLGARDLGGMKLFVDIQRWGPVLARPARPLAVLAPVAAVAARARKRIKRGSVRSTAAFHARELTVEQVLSMDRSHWLRSRDYLVAEGTTQYLANRFLRCPVRSHRLFGIVDPATSRTEGLVVTEGSSRVRVWYCEVNEAKVSESRAVELALSAMPDAETIVVPLLPASDLATEFERAGYFPGRETDSVEAKTWWSAYWKPAHPLAGAFAEMRRWKLWYAWNHH